MVVVFTVAGLWPQGTEAVPSGQVNVDPPALDDVIVVLDEGADPEAVARELGVTPTFIYDEAFTGFAAELPAAAREAAARRGDVAQITPDFPVRKFEQRLPTGVDRIDAELNPRSAIGGDGGQIDVGIAILDTGIGPNRDLNVVGGKNCIRGDWRKDGDGHGTHVAGIAAARDNQRSVVGVAPGARLWGVKVLNDNGGGTWSSVICGLEWVYEHRGTIDVVNMSLGGFGRDGDCTSTPPHRAICLVVNKGGVPVVVAAGNFGEDAARTVPATYEQVITVSSFADLDGQPGGVAAGGCRGQQDDTLDSDSNFGADIDIAAPGACILSTWPRNDVQVLSGTSMAAPHVAGAIALYLKKRPQAKPEEVRAWLLSDAASRPQSSPQGFSGDPDSFPERVLYLGGPS